jgi:phage FluMu protein Com
VCSLNFTGLASQRGLWETLFMREKGTIAVRCPTTKEINLLMKADFKGQTLIEFPCGYCKEKHIVDLDEDFSQAAARIVREATHD